MDTSRRTLIQSLLIGTTGLAAGNWTAIPIDRHEATPAEAEAKTSRETAASNGAQPLNQPAIQPRWPSPFGYAMSTYKAA
jgi:hypothetical protein